MFITHSFYSLNLLRSVAECFIFHLCYIHENYYIILYCIYRNKLTFIKTAHFSHFSHFCSTAVSAEIYC